MLGFYVLPCPLQRRAGVAGVCVSKLDRTPDKLISISQARTATMGGVEVIERPVPQRERAVEREERRILTDSVERFSGVCQG